MLKEGINMSSNFDRDIKGVPVMGTVAGGSRLRRFLTISSQDTGSGINFAKKNKYGHQ